MIFVTSVSPRSMLVKAISAKDKHATSAFVIFIFLVSDVFHSCAQINFGTATAISHQAHIVSCMSTLSSSSVLRLAERCRQLAGDIKQRQTGCLLD